MTGDRFGTYPARLRHALWIRQGITGEELSQERLAALVGKEARRKFSQPSAGAWLKGVMPREHGTQLALARVVGADPGWLYFGPANSGAPAPSVPDFLGGSGQNDVQRAASPNLPPGVSVPPLGMFPPIESADDLRRAAGEPTAKKKKRGGRR